MIGSETYYAVRFLAYAFVQGIYPWKVINTVIGLVVYAHLVCHTNAKVIGCW